MAEQQPGSRPPFRELFREKELWLLQAISICFFARPLFFGHTFFYRDLYLWSFPQRRRLVELVRSEGLPLWDPYIHGGQPFLGHTNVALYPSSLLSFVLPPIVAFNVEIVGHFLLCGLAAYLLARVVGLSRVPSFITGAVFAFCGFTLSLGNFFVYVLAMPHLPLLLLFWHLFLLERKRRWFLLAVAAGALQLLTGAAEFVIISIVLAVAWGLAFPYPGSRPRWKTLVPAPLLMLSIAGVAAIQILPTLEMVRRSARGHAPGFASSTTWSLAPRRLPELIVPGFFGRTDTLDARDYWGAEVEDESFPYILSIFFGVLATGLAASGAIGKGDRGLPTRIRRLLASIAALSLLLALGRNLHLFKLIYFAVPVVRLFRYPIKFLAGGAFAIAVLAGAGAQFSLGKPDGREGRRRAVSIAFSIAAALLATGAVLLRFHAGFAARFEKFFFLMPTFDSTVAHRLSVRVGFAACFAVLGALLAHRRWLGRTGWQLPVAATAVALELLLAGYSVNPTAPRRFLLDTPPAAEALRPLLGDGRLFRDDTPPSALIKAPSNEILWQYRWHRETIAFYTAAASDIPVVFHDDFDALAALRLVWLGDSLRRIPWQQRMPFLSAAGVSLIVTATPLSIAQLEPVGSIANASNVTFYAFRNRGAAPAVGFVPRWEFAPSNRESIARMLRPGFDPRSEVVLEGSGQQSQPCPHGAARLTKLKSGINSSRFAVETPCDGYFVFTQAFNPNWRLYAGRSRLPVLRANVVSSAAFLPSGRHELEWVYVPTGLILGSIVSVFTVLFLAIGTRSRSFTQAIAGGGDPLTATEPPVAESERSPSTSDDSRTRRTEAE